MHDTIGGAESSTGQIRRNHLPRVEGHGNLVLDLRDGAISKLDLEIVESPRFFEAMLKGRRWDEIAHITCRICGICSVGHTTASLKATEAAFGIEPSEQTWLLRRLIFHGEVIQSHVLHIGFLVAPDFLGVGSVVPLLQTHPEIVTKALALKKLANDLCAVVGGRHIHPIAMAVNGFTALPSLQSLAEMRDRVVAARKPLDEMVDFFASVKLPAFERETEYLALSQPEEYAFVRGDLTSSLGYRVAPDRYHETIEEFVVDRSTAKHARTQRPSYMVGALARFNINGSQLLPRAREAASALGLAAPCFNPYANNWAQLVETVHCLEDAITLIDRIRERGLAEETREVNPCAGTGVGACEVPRGTLYHEYTYDEAGSIVRANLVIPTAQNLNNLELDMRALGPQIVDRPQEEIVKSLEMLVRAYDPCISCSTHMLEVKLEGEGERGTGNGEWRRANRERQTMDEEKRTRILGFGNVLRRDDGVGVRVVEELKRHRLPPDVEAVEAGTGSWDLAEPAARQSASWRTGAPHSPGGLPPLLEGVDRVVLVDAVDWKGEPGEVAWFTPEDVGPAMLDGFSAHEFRLPEALFLCSVVRPAVQILICGIQPESVEAGTELSATVADRMDEIVGELRKRILEGPG